MINKCFAKPQKVTLGCEKSYEGFIGARGLIPDMYRGD
jgi:hypothetical protein